MRRINKAGLERSSSHGVSWRFFDMRSRRKKRGITKGVVHSVHIVVFFFFHFLPLVEGMTLWVAALASLTGCCRDDHIYTHSMRGSTSCSHREFGLAAWSSNFSLSHVSSLFSPGRVSAAVWGGEQ
jgi:hypothetical protein